MGAAETLSNSSSLMEKAVTATYDNIVEKGFGRSEENESDEKGIALVLKFLATQPGAAAAKSAGIPDAANRLALQIAQLIGLKDHRIVAIGKAGNPDTQPGVDIIIGPGTEVIACEGHIVTAGGIDSHIHFICPQQIEEALMSGVTTMIGGGTGPATGSRARCPRTS